MRDNAISGNAGFDINLERSFGAEPAVVYDTFLDMYINERPEWIVESNPDLRPGGTWTLVFHPPGLAEFREVRVLSAVERPNRLAYEMTASFNDAPDLRTNVDMTFEEQGTGTRESFAQSGFPAAAARDQFASAWGDVFDELDRRVAERSRR